jgi:hypothetical protein
MAGVCDTFDRLSCWLGHGRIQDAGGGVFSWCDDRFSPSYVYPEVSGYLLTVLASGILPLEHARERALRCAEFLTSRIRAGQLGARPSEETVIYNFDQAMIATGLMRAHARLGADTLAEGLQLADLLREQILKERFLPTVCARGAVPKRGNKWSTVGTLHLAKCTQALLLAGEHGLERANEAAHLLAGHTLAQLRSMEQPYTCPGSPEIHLHAVLYCAEGMWIYGKATGAQSALDCSEGLLKYVLAQMDRSGALTATIGGSVLAPEQGDVAAQLLRLALLHRIPEDIVELTYARLCRFFRSQEAWTAVEYQVGSDHYNTWATIFAAQACSLMCNPGVDFDWRDLA